MVHVKRMYSLTQSGNIVAFAGTISLILKAFNIDIAPGELETALGALASLIGIAISWYGRYRQGDLTVGGFRKQ